MQDLKGEDFFVMLRVQLKCVTRMCCNSNCVCVGTTIGKTEWAYRKFATRTPRFSHCKCVVYLWSLCASRVCMCASLIAEAVY